MAPPLTCRPWLSFLGLQAPFVITYSRTEPDFTKHLSFLLMVLCICSLAEDYGLAYH